MQWSLPPTKNNSALLSKGILYILQYIAIVFSHGRSQRHSSLALQILLEFADTAVNVNSNIFVRLMIVRVELVHAINASLDVGLAVVLQFLATLFDLLPIIIVGHVSRSYHHVLFQQGETVCPHLNQKRIK